MSEQAEKTRKLRAKRWTEGEARAVLQDLGNDILQQRAVESAPNRNHRATPFAPYDLRHARLTQLAESGTCLERLFSQAISA